jgi:hypothetical protein
MLHMPLTDDMEEAHGCNEFLAEAVLRDPQTIFAPDNSRFEKFVIILGTICNKKQSEENTLNKLAVIIGNLSNDPTYGSLFQSICLNKLDEEKRSKISDVYSTLSDEVR